VEAHRRVVPRGLQTAVQPGKLEPAAAAIKELVSAIREEQVPRELIYTSMMRASSLEPGESMRLAFNFRDLPGFLQKLQDDPQVTSARVKEAAAQAALRVRETILDHHRAPGKELLKDANGYTAYMPWSAPTSGLRESYEKLDWVVDSDWGRLLDYVFEPSEHPLAQPLAVAQGRLSPGQRLAKTALFGYKKYIAPFLNVACPQTPSCSQYAREAVEKHGLWEGSKLGLMRVLSCTGHGQKNDPVPQKDEHGHLSCHQAHAPAAAPHTPARRPDVVIAPPIAPERSKVRRWAEGCAVAGAQLTGHLIGGVLGAAAALPLGLAFGAVTGVHAGRGTIDAFNQELLKKYRLESMQTLLDVEVKLGAPAMHARDWALARSGESAANLAGTLTGAVTGTVLGALGGALTGWSWGSKFGRLGLGNLVKDLFGLLPRHPVNEAILQKDYGA
ncbi:MAG: membrane protein insertion efficiency factor YidD, partial [Candidatus Eremiobacterota bacterium]